MPPVWETATPRHLVGQSVGVEDSRKPYTPGYVQTLDLLHKLVEPLLRMYLLLLGYGIESEHTWVNFQVFTISCTAFVHLSGVG